MLPWPPRPTTARPLGDAPLQPLGAPRAVAEHLAARAQEDLLGLAHQPAQHSYPSLSKPLWVGWQMLVSTTVVSVLSVLARVSLRSKARTTTRSLRH
jgi:hypothetical protein